MNERNQYFNINLIRNIKIIPLLNYYEFIDHIYGLENINFTATPSFYNMFIEVNLYRKDKPSYINTKYTLMFYKKSTILSIYHINKPKSSKKYFNESNTNIQLLVKFLNEEYT